MLRPARAPATVIGTQGRGLRVTSSDYVPPTLRLDQPSDSTIAVSGELDMASAPQLAAAIEQIAGRGQNDIVLDLSELRFCDSSGLSVFVQAHRDLRAAGGGLTLRNPSERLLMLLATTKLDDELNID